MFIISLGLSLRGGNGNEGGERGKKLVKRKYIMKYAIRFDPPPPTVLVILKKWIMQNYINYKNCRRLLSFGRRRYFNSISLSYRFTLRKSSDQLQTLPQCHWIKVRLIRRLTLSLASVPIARILILEFLQANNYIEYWICSYMFGWSRINIKSCFLDHL